MKAPSVIIVHHAGHEVECYGELTDTSNFSVLCEDEEHDDVWVSGNPISGNPFVDWETVVEALQLHFESRIVEISTC